MGATRLQPRRTLKQRWSERLQQMRALACAGMQSFMRGSTVLGVVVLVLMICASAWHLVTVSRAYPIAHVSVEGRFHALAQEQVRQVLLPQVSGNYFTVDLAAVHHAVAALPWAEQVEVTRVWPNRLRVKVREHEPVARWGGEALISSRGERFYPPLIPGETAAMPLLAGPDTEFADVLHQYERINEVLRDAGLQVQELKMTDRMTWHMRLNNGIAVVVDQNDMAWKLKRFAYLYRHYFDVDRRQMEAVDLRYGNGLAIRWKQNAVAAVEVKHDAA